MSSAATAATQPKAQALARNESVPLWALLLLLMSGPLCFGAFEPWSLLLLEIGSVVILFLWIAGSWRTARMTIDIPTIALLAFGFVALIQIVSGIAVYRYASEQEMLRLCVYFLFFLVGSELFVPHEARKLAASCFTIFGSLIAIFAIVQKLHGNGLIYWLRESSSSGFFGPYANKDHYAGLMEMLIPFALAALSNERQRSKRALCAFSAGVMIASVWMSGSRTGSAIVMLELVAFEVAALIGGKRRPWPLSYKLCCACIIALAMWLGGECLVQQSAVLFAPSADASLINRRQLTLDSLELAKQRPILGWGVGAFPTVYPQVATWYGDTLVNAAHDDYLQALVESGFAGVAVLVLFVISVLVVGLRRFARASTSIRSAAFLAISALLLHSFLDFNLHVPANAAIFFALCGLVCTHPRRELA